MAPFVSYNFVDLEGRIKLSFSGTDPDGSADTLTYSLYLGSSQNNLFLADSGRSQSFIAQHIMASSVYFWKLRVKDLFGDSIQAFGSFTTAAPPGAPGGMKLIRSGSKSFVMGQTGFDPSEVPQHSVLFTYHFWMDSAEVSQKDYSTIMGLSPDQSSDGALPAANCTWFDAALYCNARSKQENKDTVYSYQSIIGTKGKKCTLTGLSINLDAGGYRLPTEAEWEFACRAGTQTLFFWGIDHIDADANAWLADYSNNQTHAIATKLPNAFGLYDMAGNVWEWCNDWFDTQYYSTSPSENPTGPQSGQERSIRGGSFRTTYYFAQCATRSKMKPEIADASIGFRAILVNR
jgi:formylglycine-generating enzyme required for sulfatase activity